MPSCNTYRLTWVSLTLDVGYLLLALLCPRNCRSLNVGLLFSAASPDLRCVVLSCCYVCLFATPWTVAPQAPLSMGVLQVRILEWVAMPSSRGDRTQVTHIGG